MRPIYLFTDFGLDGPWLGQVHAAARAVVPGVEVVNLLADAPLSRPRPAAYLLEACVRDLPGSPVFCCVVDPAVGSERGVLAVQTENGLFVGPDNGLLSRVARSGATVREVLWRPDRLSNSFHGRDLFAPAAALWAAGHQPASTPAIPFAESRPGSDWPDDLAQVIYVDGFGNAMTGIRAESLRDPARVLLSAFTVLLQMLIS